MQRNWPLQGPRLVDIRTPPQENNYYKAEHYFMRTGSCCSTANCISRAAYVELYGVSTAYLRALRKSAYLLTPMYTFHSSASGFNLAPRNNGKQVKVVRLVYLRRPLCRASAGSHGCKGSLADASDRPYHRENADPCSRFQSARNLCGMIPGPGENGY